MMNPTYVDELKSEAIHKNTKFVSYDGKNQPAMQIKLKFLNH